MSRALNLEKSLQTAYKALMQIKIRHEASFAALSLKARKETFTVHTYYMQIAVLTEIEQEITSMLFHCGGRIACAEIRI